MARVIVHVAGGAAAQLERQLGLARVVGGLPTFLDIAVGRPLVDGAAVNDGPLPVRSVVSTEAGEVVGEILVWVTHGYLSGLEYAWYADETPVEMPAPERVKSSPVE